MAIVNTTASCFHAITSFRLISKSPSLSFSPLSYKCNNKNNKISNKDLLFSSSKSLPGNGRTKRVFQVAAAAGNVASPSWDAWLPDKTVPPPPLSDIVWPALGGFATMAMFGKIDQILAPKGITMTIAPLGAVCAVLFLTPKTPGARKYNMFMAQTGCSAIGVLALSLLGPGWLARSAALAASLAFMVYTRCTHPPAASLPLLFIDGAKLHHLNFWYSLFPGAAGCILTALIQEIVCHLKENYKF